MPQDAQSPAPNPAAPSKVLIGIACALLVVYVVFLALMWSYIGPPDEVHWSRAVYLFSGFEAIAFSAVGYLFGKEVHRQEAANAQDTAKAATERADKSSADAKDAQKDKEAAQQEAANGKALAASVIAAHTPPPSGGISVAGGSSGVNGNSSTLDLLAAQAKALFP